MFYKNKTVCVICNLDEDSIEDIKFLCEVCKKIYCIIEKKSDPKILLKESNIEIIHETPKEILGDDKANNLLLSNNKNIECDGIFILKEFTPIDRIIYGLGIDNGVIKVNRACETNLAGVFAAGDCTGWPMQLSKAIGEGQIAAQAAAKFIDSKK
jgi:thioredoxin reductase (NADPH)